MQYPSRNDDEAKYARRLATLSSKQRAELRRLLGFPPNPANVPASFWSAARAEAERQNNIALYLIFMNSATFHLDGASDDDRQRLRESGNVKTYGDAYAAALAAGMAERWAESARKRFEEAANRMRQAEAPDGSTTLSKGELEDLLADTFSPDDAAGAAAYGTTNAETAGGEAAAKETYGITAQDTWQTNPHLTRSGPCERCEAENGKQRKDWAQRYPSGPPIHEYCACTLNYANFGKSG